MTGEHVLHATSAPVRARPESMAVLDLHYRSVGAFLCAYSARLSRGELFLETDKPLPAGTEATLRFRVPGAAPLPVEGVVKWTRLIAIGPGQPAGMGIVLTSSIEVHGAAIDELASRYTRIRVLVTGTAPAPRAVVGRYLRSILACEVIELGSQRGPSGADLELGDQMAKAIDGGIDLVIVDWDAERSLGESVIQRVKTNRATANLRIIALAQFERDRAAAASLGADEVLTAPPLFTELRSTVIHALSHPSAWTR